MEENVNRKGEDAYVRGRFFLLIASSTTKGFFLTSAQTTMDGFSGGKGEGAAAGSQTAALLQQAKDKNKQVRSAQQHHTQT